MSGRYRQRVMGATGKIDRLAGEGVRLTHRNAHDRYSLGRAALVTGQLRMRTGPSTFEMSGAVGMSSATQGLQVEEPPMS